MKGILAYQHPNTSIIKSFYGTWKQITKTQLLNLKNGFVFVDFKEVQAYVFESETNLNWEVDAIIYTPIANQQNTQFEIDKVAYLNNCRQFIDACEKNENGIHKLVLSRVKKVDLPTDFSVQKYFSRLCQTYQHSFNYCVHIPQIATWIGATPEELVVEKEHHFTTVSLAGTRLKTDDKPFGEKEYEEQHIVTEYIEKTLLNQGIQFKVSETPIEVIAGNLKHLKSFFSIEKTSNLTTIASVLHPTPAVCGMPKKEAQKYILSNEIHDRRYYSGYLGNIGEGGNFMYVNLRCGEFFEKSCNLYVGGGITAQSLSEKEWEETENKSQTLMSLIYP